MKLILAAPQGASKPSVGTVKSTRVVGLPATSTKAKLGKRPVIGPCSSPFSFMAAKFSPLIQMRSIEPP
jgi:hypothetical protein